MQKLALMTSPEFQPTPVPLDVPKVFERSGWQNLVRFLALGLILAMDVLCATSSFRQFWTQALTVEAISKQLVGYLLLFICNLTVLPSIIFEARRVEAFSDRLVIYNLIYEKTLRWEDIRQVATPAYLKFAIIKTRGFFYLINKRDVERFPDLIQIIRERAVNAVSA